MRCGLSGVLMLLVVAGCGSPSARPISVPARATSDVAKVRAADISVLFVGNSHTTHHDLPDLVARMIRWRQPTKSVVTHVLSVGYLEDAARDSRFQAEIDTEAWKFVVLQAQKISRSGKHHYSRKEGIDLARQAKARGAAVYYFAEWGERDVAGDGPRHEKVYREMAAESEVDVIPIGRAWDVALAERPELRLHDDDGNHQSATGAFLTACVLAGCLSGESPASLAGFPYEPVNEVDRRYLANAAAAALDKATPRP